MMNEQHNILTHMFLYVEL